MSPPDSARVVVLTSGNPVGLGVARRLSQRGIRFQLLLQNDAALSRCFKRRGWRRIPELPLALARSAWRMRRSLQWRAALRPFAQRVIVSGARNSPRMRDDLAALAPDLLVLAGVGLVDRTLLAVPRWGTLNGHPGLLPFVRGNGVVAHAIARGVAIGASVHHVDDGIDRGPIVARRLLPVGAELSTLPALEAAAVTLACDLLADVVAGALREGALPEGAPQVERMPLCRWMRPADREHVEGMIRDGAAARLFDRWRERYGVQTPPWDLPRDPTPPLA